MNVGKQAAGIVQKFAVTASLLTVAFAVQAQVQTTTTTAPAGAPTKTVSVERGTVVAVSGNNLIVKAEDGTLRDFNNIPDSTTVTVNGQQLNVHQLTPGMVLERQTVTTTTPRRVTVVKTVSGKITFISAPNSVILRMDDGTSQRFTIPKGTKFTVDGRQTDAFGLRKGMTISAQQVTEESEMVAQQEIKRTGTAPPPPPPPDPAVPILVVFLAAPAPAAAPVAAAPAEPAPTALPKTASELPLLGLLGAFFIAMGLGLKGIRVSKA